MFVAVSVSALVSAVALLGPTPAGATVRTSVTRLAPGLTLTKITMSSGPERIRVLTVNPARAVMVDTTLAAPTFGTFATVGAMAKANGAIAAINGDYGEWWPNERPVHSFTDNGTLYATGSQDSAFAVSADETQSHVSRAKVAVTGVIAGATPVSFKVAAWNTGKPGTATIYGYTAVGGSIAPPPRSSCWARLSPAGGLTWAAAKVGVSATYTVSAQGCGTTPLPLNLDVVLAAQQSGTAAPTLTSMLPGASVTLTWTLGLWPDVTTSVGGGPMLVSAGKIVAPTGCGYLCSTNPRTGVGVTTKGRILLVTVDGRNPGWSAGMTLVAFAKEMRALGAVQAMNLDGGGSSTMWTRRYGLVNRPTDCLPSICQRHVSSAVLVLPAAETAPAITVGLRPAVTPASLAAGGAAWQLMLSDPGSTGGYMDALARGSLGHVEPLPASYLRIAKAFRASVHS